MRSKYNWESNDAHAEIINVTMVLLTKLIIRESCGASHCEMIWQGDRPRVNAREDTRYSQRVTKTHNGFILGRGMIYHALTHPS